jgi:hypothetical protein
MRAPFSSTIAISSQTVVILLETQGLLRQLSLPCIDEPGTVSFDSFFQETRTFSNLRHVTFNIVLSADPLQVISSIVRRLLGSSELHLRFLTVEVNRQSMSLRARSSVSSLLSVATRLTLQAHDFGSSGMNFSHVSLPCLCALALVDCPTIPIYFHGLQASNCPRLSALMIEGENLIMCEPFQDFIKDLTSLRELVVRGKHVLWGGPIMLGSHTDTLELLALSRVDDDLKTKLYQLTAIRHLCLSVDEYLTIGREGKHVRFRTDVQALLVSYCVISSKLKESDANRMSLPRITPFTPCIFDAVPTSTPIIMASALRTQRSYQT